MKKCPRCKSTFRHRIRRKGLMKLISGTKAYAGEKCNVRYTWFPLLKPLYKAKKKPYKLNL
jgi:hypothetical protein